MRTALLIALMTMAPSVAWLALSQATAVEVTRPEEVYFERYSDRLPGRNRPYLNEWVRTISRMSADEIAVVEGHADDEGDAEFMVYLSRRRAETVVAALVELGAPRGRIRIEAYGDERPAVDERGEESARWNRRCSLLIQSR